MLSAAGTDGLRKPVLAKKPAFLAAFKICASLTEAAAAVSIRREQHYDWLRNDPKYSAAFAQAKTEAAQTLVDSAVKRVELGVFEPNIFKGRFTYPQEQYETEPAVRYKTGKRKGKIRKPAVTAIRDIPGAAPFGVYRRSEALHLALLRAWVPEFKTNFLEVTGPGGGPIEIVERLNAARKRFLNEQRASEPPAGR